MSEVVVAGAAVVRGFRLFVARRSRPSAMSGYWELPGGVLHDGEDGYQALEREFTSEFSISIRCVDRILSDQRLADWESEDGDRSDATLRIWRCQLPSQSSLDLDAGEPRPNRNSYDESAWVPIDRLDSVGPWRDADWIMAGEVANYYRNDTTWQAAD